MEVQPPAAPPQRRARRVIAWLFGAALLASCGQDPVDRDGIYSGPDGAFVRVVKGHVAELRLTLKGNASTGTGLGTFSGENVDKTGMVPVQGDTFEAQAVNNVTIFGTFVDGNRRIEGTWSQPPVKGSWSAAKN